MVHNSCHPCGKSGYGCFTSATFLGSLPNHSDKLCSTFAPSTMFDIGNVTQRTLAGLLVQKLCLTTFLACITTFFALLDTKDPLAFTTIARSQNMDISLGVARYSINTTNNSYKSKKKIRNIERTKSPNNHSRTNNLCDMFFSLRKDLVL
jgi:hypothetical protein